MRRDDASAGARRRDRLLLLPFLVSSALLSWGCEGDTGPQGPPGPPGDPGTPDELDLGDEAPGVNVEILEVTGASGPGGTFQVGDRITVRYTVEKDDGTAWDLDELDLDRILVSGPTFNYQRVIAQQSDLFELSTTNTDGSHTYRFEEPIPDVYLPPLNDTPSFGPEDGELQGQPLLSGTYTVGMYVAWNFSVAVSSHRDQGDATADFLFGDATTLAPREVVAQANCNQCHLDLQAHGGQRKDVTLCLLCHTAGAEDKNDPSAAGGTPGVSISFDVLVHKIHAGRHLPSVLGVTTNPDGSRDYTADPEPYQVVGFMNTIHDYSAIGFPVWPERSSPMPRDAGHADLPPEHQALEDAIRTGPTRCAACHGDPDGAGPLPPPAQGGIAFSQPSRQACGACHDDVVWEFPYTSNLSTMPPQDDDSACTICHEVTGGPLAVMDAHVHPLLDPAFDPGLVLEITSVSEGGLDDGDGTIDPGEKVAISFTMTDDAGAPVDPGEVSSLSAAISGPTGNYNLVHSTSLSLAALGAGPTHELNLPMRVDLEHVGTGTAGTSDSFGTSFTPHLDLPGAETIVFARTATSGGDSVAAAAVEPPVNFVDVADPTGFERGDEVVLDDGVPGLEEYLVIQFVEGNRLWFSSPASPDFPPGPKRPHAAGATVREVVLTPLAEVKDYVLDPAAGTVTEVGGAFGAGTEIVVSYTTDFVMPDVYPLQLNDSPDLGPEVGKWRGLDVLPGTYTAALWGHRTLVLEKIGESNTYRSAAEAAEADFLVGTAAEIEPYAPVPSDQNCLRCHDQLLFHGGMRRGFASCIVCHGPQGSEDRPRYVAAAAPETPGLSVGFARMLHRIHRGHELANPSAYQVVGFGPAFLYPNNFSVVTFEDVHYPAMPEGTKNCGKCHEGSDAWKEPPAAEWKHPDQTAPVTAWGFVCGSCHDSDAAQAHIETQTSAGGLEACGVCHAQGDELSVENVHKTY